MWLQNWTKNNFIIEIDLWFALKTFQKGYGVPVVKKHAYSTFNNKVTNSTVNYRMLQYTVESAIYSKSIPTSIFLQQIYILYRIIDEKGWPADYIHSILYVQYI